MKKRDPYQTLQVRTWQMSFNDLLTVLLAFFILVVSMSNIRADKVQDLSSAAVKSFRTDMTQDSGAQLIRTLNGVEGIEARRVAGGVSIALSESLLYRSGSADIVHQAFLRRVGETLKTQTGAIRVEGHTDSLPIGRGPFSSNWELSAQRAVNAVKFLIGECGIDPKRLSAAGYGDSKPLAPNGTPEGRAANRRVNIIISLQ
jgi:chemotaxis protein MotB